MPWLKNSAIVIIACSIFGCSTTATVYTTRGQYVEAEISRSDRENVCVKTLGKPLSISRNDITDIDHSGNVTAMLGVPVLGAGFTGIGFGMKS